MDADKDSVQTLNIQPCWIHQHGSLEEPLVYMGLVATKPFFRVLTVRFKPACTATETSLINEISLVASLDMILSNKRITKALISLRGCAGWSAPLLFANPRRQVFLRRGSYISHGIFCGISLIIMHRFRSANIFCVKL